MAGNTHVSDESSFITDDDGFFIPRCRCGWTFGPVPDIETVADVLMGHVAEVSGK